MVGLAPVPTGSELPGDRYRLDERIAGGGMGQVWRAWDLVLQRPVAVKMLDTSSAADEVGLARFRAEARHAGSLSHPGIARVYDYHEAEPPVPPYLVMELVDGPSLARMLDQGPMTPARTMDLIAQAARALQAAHAAGLIHRDIKPGNLLVSRDGQLKITDFGIAHAMGSLPLTRPGALIGTPAYLAPERAVGASATPAADLYALGIVAYQCLTGTVPFHGPPLAVALAHQEQPLPPLPASVPPGVAALVAALAAKDPRGRPESAGLVAEQAERLRTAPVAPVPTEAGVPAGVGVGAGAVTRPRPERGRRRGGPAYAAVAAAAAIAAGTVWMLAGAHGPGSASAPSGPPAASRSASAGGSRSAGPVAASRAGGGGRGAQAPVVGGGSASSAGSGVTPAAAVAAKAGSPIGTGSAVGARRPTRPGSRAGAGSQPGAGSPVTSGAPTLAGVPAPAGSPTTIATPAPTGSPTVTPTGTGTVSESPAPSGTAAAGA
ncbi:MAG: protein kinase [Actinobacteria bacterium]|nr:protein kinase [Actinomycetota bacterium]